MFAFRDDSTANLSDKLVAVSSCFGLFACLCVRHRFVSSYVGIDSPLGVRNSLSDAVISALTARTSVPPTAPLKSPLSDDDDLGLSDRYLSVTAWVPPTTFNCLLFGCVDVLSSD